MSTAWHPSTELGQLISDLKQRHLNGGASRLVRPNVEQSGIAGQQQVAHRPKATTRPDHPYAGRLRCLGSECECCCLHDQGTNWAEATEGSPAVWARERYEWSDNRVVGTTQDSNVWQPGGTWTLTVEPRNRARGHIQVVLDRRWKAKGLLCPCGPLRPTNVQEEPAEDVERARVQPLVRRTGSMLRRSTSHTFGGGGGALAD